MQSVSSLVVDSAFLDARLQFVQLRSVANSGQVLCSSVVREAVYRADSLSPNDDAAATAEQQCVHEGHLVFFTDVNNGVLAKFSVPVPDVNNVIYWQLPFANVQAAQSELPAVWTAASVRSYVLRQEQGVIASDIPDGDVASGVEYSLVSAARPTWLVRGLVKPSALLLEDAGVARYFGYLMCTFVVCMLGMLE